jgi:hypothetical protein
MNLDMETVKCINFSKSLWLTMKIKKLLTLSSFSMFIIFICFIGLSLLGYIYTVDKYGGDYFFQNYSIGELIIGLGTVTLAFFTASLADSSTGDAKKSRDITLQENKKERRRLRIKEQLEGLYSPLMSYIYLFNVVDEHFSLSERHLYGASPRDPKTAIWLLIQEIRGKYNFLAEPELREELNKYYMFRDDPPYDEHGNYINEKGEIFLDILNKVQKMIVEDFEKLTKEYNDLVAFK